MVQAPLWSVVLAAERAVTFYLQPGQVLRNVRLQALAFRKKPSSNPLPSKPATRTDSFCRNTFFENFFKTSFFVFQGSSVF